MGSFEMINNIVDNNEANIENLIGESLNQCGCENSHFNVITMTEET